MPHVLQKGVLHRINFKLYNSEQFIQIKLNNIQLL